PQFSEPDELIRHPDPAPRVLAEIDNLPRLVCVEHLEVFVVSGSTKDAKRGGDQHVARVVDIERANWPFAEAKSWPHLLPAIRNQPVQSRRTGKPHRAVVIFGDMGHETLRQSVLLAEVTYVVASDS